MVTTNTIVHASNATPLLAESVKALTVSEQR
jgi:hypothetical protein